MVSKEEFEELRLKLATYEAQQELSPTQMKQEVKEQVGEVTVGFEKIVHHGKRCGWKVGCAS